MHPGETSINNSDKDKTAQESRKVCTLSPEGYILPVLLDKNLKGSLGGNAELLPNSHAQKPIRKKGPLRLRNGDPFQRLRSRPTASGSERASSSQASKRLWRWELFPRGSTSALLQPLSSPWASKEPGDLGACVHLCISCPHFTQPRPWNSMPWEPWCNLGACAGFFPGLWQGWTLFPICAPPGPRWGRGKWGDARYRCIIEGHQKLSSHDK